MKKASRSKTKPAHAKKQRTGSKRRKTKRTRRAVPLTVKCRRARRRARGRTNVISLQGTRRMVKGSFHAEVHAKRVESLANGATGTMLAARAAIHAIGAAYAEVAEIKPRQCWQTVRKSSLGEGRRTEIEIALIERLGCAIAPEVAITLLADRGFGNQQFYQVLDQLGWGYIIRFRGDTTVTHAGESRPARAWLPASSRTIVKLYGRRFTIEETFRDVKDVRFGMGLRQTRIRKEARRDRLLMLLASPRRCSPCSAPPRCRQLDVKV